MNVGELIREAIAKSPEPYTEAEVLESVSTGYAKMFKADDSIMILTLQEHGDGSRSAHCWMASGKLDTIKNELMPQAEKWAKDNGCNRATIEGRRGWARVLRDAGYREETVTLGKQL